MIWTQWTFIAIVVVLVALAALVVARNPERYITKIYTNPLAAILLGTVAVIVFAWFAGQHTALEKAAFGLGTLLATRLFIVAMTFAELFSPMPNVRITRLDVNMIGTVLCIFAILAGMLTFIGVQQFADAAVESIAGAVGAGLLSVIGVYMEKDRSHDKE